MTKKGPYRTSENQDGDLVPTVAQCRRGYTKAAEARELAKRREQAAWERYLKDELAARQAYLQEESAARKRFGNAGKEMLGWRYLAQGFHDEEFSPHRVWKTESDLTWSRCIELQEESWLDRSVESTLKAFIASLAENDESSTERHWPEDVEEMWRVFKGTRGKIVDPTRTPSLENNSFLDGHGNGNKK